MRDGVTTTNDKSDIYAFWLDTLVSPLQRVVEPTSDELTRLVPDLCMKNLSCVPDSKARCGDTGQWDTVSAFVHKTWFSL